MVALVENFELGRGEYNTNAAGLACPSHRFGSDVDDFSVISASAYFDDILAGDIGESNVRIGDMINITDSTGSAQVYRITAVSPNVTVQAVTGTNLSHEIIAAGFHNSVGGAALEQIPVAGALSTDISIVTLEVEGFTPRTILTNIAVTDFINVTFSGDPSNDHQVNFELIRDI